ncbi:MAG: Helicase associated domain protein [Ruminococcus sp.]|nr:Helicase associated domain protein [Ruminococcus sp.]
MSIELFEHNRQAYDSAVAMLAAAGKACVIHPTGTGKSFIGFKLCEDNPEKTVCWLSPSDYIFRTQLENLAAAADGWDPENITFFTYAKLMNMTDSEIADIKPNYIILDEFHRCGAQMWGEGVQRLLAAYPDIPILGLSATAIRYLDDQRNMAEELFDSCIASEMTLGEAIVLGILAPPKYVLSMFSYQKDLKRYETRVKRAKYKAIRDEAGKYLDALKRALENAEGLDVIFDKHITDRHGTDRHGKYIVFTTNYEHLTEYRELALDWFSRIDSEPHIYSVYTPDPSTSAEFDAFKEDSSEHLKLLFCIDALNEGIHIPDISGVILMRPTVFPIIFKQQIGRALSASTARVPVIFDIVNNIENLYSIDSLKEEMETAIAYYRSHSGESEVINDSFEIIDKLADCRELFDRLEDTLSASWDMMYEKLVEYHKAYGNVDVSFDYMTEDFCTLGVWVARQRRIYNGKLAGTLTEEMIDKLNKLGMRWQSTYDIGWERNYTAAKAYFDEYGDLLVPADYIDKDGVKLGKWICCIRSYRKSGIRMSSLTEEHIKDLDEIGMMWDTLDYIWERNYNAAVEYFHKNGNLDVPASYVDPNGVRLWEWINKLRRLRQDKPERLTDEQIRRLDEIGMLWGTKKERQWEKGNSELCRYKKKYGNVDVPASYVSNGIRLYSWLDRQRRLHEKGSDYLDTDKTERLETLGVEWEKTSRWEKNYQLAKKYYDENGTLNIRCSQTNGLRSLQLWVNKQKRLAEGKENGRQKGKLSTERIKLLDAIGMVW